MKWIPELRALGLLRRIAKALEEGNEIRRMRMAMEFPDWARTSGRVKNSRLAKIETATIDEWNEQWREETGKG